MIINFIFRYVGIEQLALWHQYSITLVTFTLTVVFVTFTFATAFATVMLVKKTLKLGN